MREALVALTARGRAFVAAGVTTTACAIALGLDALMRVGVLAVALPVLTAFAVGHVRYRLRARRSLEPARIAQGQTAHIDLALSNEGRLPAGMLLFEDRVPPALGRSQRFTLDRMGPSWRRTLRYTVTPERRGHYELGPLTVRVCDPFGFIELNRTFRSTSRVAVTPRVTRLPPTVIVGHTAESGERRARAASTGTAEDVTVREYRRGDDLRRVHWRSTARAGELMVRREEEPWQQRATVLLDTRRSAHTSDQTGSFEWAVEAAASICVHLDGLGFTVRLVTGRDEPLGGAADTTALILDELAAVTPSSRVRASDLAGGLLGSRGVVVAVLGRCEDHELVSLDRRLGGANRRFALLLDTDAWRGASPSAHLRSQQRTLGHRWQTTAVSPRTGVAQAWADLIGIGVPPTLVSPQVASRTSR